MQQDKEFTPVVFRKERDDVTAVFPTLPADERGYEMTCCAHIGQHSACSWHWYCGTIAARPGDYAELFRELERIGYRLKVYKRITGKMRDECKRNAREDNKRVLGA